MGDEREMIDLVNLSVLMEDLVCVIHTRDVTVRHGGGSMMMGTFVYVKLVYRQHKKQDRLTKYSFVLLNAATLIIPL